MTKYTTISNKTMMSHRLMRSRSFSIYKAAVILMVLFMCSSYILYRTNKTARQARKEKSAQEQSARTMFMQIKTLEKINYLEARILQLENDLRNTPTEETTVGITESTGKGNISCVLPRLNVNDPSIKQFFREYPPLDCGSHTDWITLHNGQFVPNEAANAFKPFSCTAQPLLRTNDYENSWGEPILEVETGRLTINHDTDFFKVTCQSSNGQQYDDTLAGIRQDYSVYLRPIVGQMGGLGLDVLMFGQDSVSRMAMHRSQPKTLDYLINTLGAIEMQGYAILGDGTPAALLPLLTGKREEELPEARRGYTGAKPVDNFPWVWNDFKDNGYVTMWNEQSPDIGTFHYRMLGFTKPPVDHYWRPYSIARSKDVSQGGVCLKSKAHYQLVFDYMRDMWTSYPNVRRKWAFSFMDMPSHADNNKLMQVDELLRDNIKRFHDDGLLDNTLLVVMSDHGSRAGSVRAFDQGKLEERMPFFSLRFPPWVHKRYPQIIANIKHNSKMLTTPFDVHETFREILNFTGHGPADTRKRGVSLFKRIPEDRTCKSAAVDAHWCACMAWKPVDVTSERVKEAAREIIYHFNNKTASYRRQCPLLSVKRILSASEHTANEAVLKFKDSNDQGRGRWGDMSDNTAVSMVTYQVTLQTTPGGGQFEVTLTRKQDSGAWFLDPKAVSRINVYGDAPKCVAAKAPHLREYCVCQS